MAASLLITCSVGLITAYVVLIYNMRKYFKEQMRNEMRRLTVLFASFVLAYLLRSLYQIGLMTSFYKELINSLVWRWYLIDVLPLIWDLASIVSILILHYTSFSDTSNSNSNSSNNS